MLLTDYRQNATLPIAAAEAAVAVVSPWTCGGKGRPHTADLL